MGGGGSSLGFRFQGSVSRASGQKGFSGHRPESASRLGFRVFWGLGVLCSGVSVSSLGVFKG